MNMRIKEFTTKDFNGCEFSVKAYYSFEKHIDYSTGKLSIKKERNDLYEAVGMNITANSLKELKTKITNLP